MLINNIKENVSEVVIFTEVKFIKKFLQKLWGENCHGKKRIKMKVYKVNHKGDVHDKGVSDDHNLKCFILHCAIITIQKVRGTMSGCVQVQRGTL